MARHAMRIATAQINVTEKFACSRVVALLFMTCPSHVAKALFGARLVENRDGVDQAAQHLLTAHASGVSVRGM